MDYIVLNQIKFHFEMCSMVPFDDVMSLSQIECDYEPSKLLYKESYDIITEYLLGDACIDFEKYFTHQVIECDMTRQYQNVKLSNDLRKRLRRVLCESSFRKFTNQEPIKPPKEMYDYTFECIFDNILNYKSNSQDVIIKNLIDYTDYLFPVKE